LRYDDRVALSFVDGSRPQGIEVDVAFVRRGCGPSNI